MTGRARRAEGGPSPALDRIQHSVITCERCPRLRAHCTRIASVRKREFREHTYWGKPVPAFGDPQARLVIVGLAPAAHGANRTGRMFTGDSSGDWLYEALHRFGFANQPLATSRNDGLTLRDCWITASARCAPPDNKPTTAELEACAEYLTAELRYLSNMEMVVALGRIAHERWLKASGWWEAFAPSDRPAFGHGVMTGLPDDTMLLSSYHPSRQNTNTGRLTREMWYSVFRRARQFLSDPP